ncbi:DUF423 domain-containing protein [Daejeonella oryzae]|uniref:DUF423 domain-containing protein n=1 Tax=Daejeonella oryzae TaxID=1122943 RepID=UPI000402DAE8|nr:DUF423 domain-containing protein [Daejeonella oryzae]
MNQRTIRTAAIFGMLAVVFGAFAAHGLKAKISASELNTWNTAVEYQFYHVFALLSLSLISKTPNKFINWAYWSFTAGIIFFCGSLYLLATKELLQIDQISILGPVTPVGGVFFIMGWVSLLISTFKNK